jgi:hypothetical protein
MKKRFFLIVLVIARAMTIHTENNTVQCDSKQMAHWLEGDTGYHIDAAFAQKGFGTEFALAGIKKKYGNSLIENRKIVSNNYNATIKDTIITLCGKGMKFVFYKHQQGAILTEAAVTSPLLLLQKGIKTGMSKKEVTKKFPSMAVAMIAADTWQIGNEERTQYFEWIFANSILKTIHYYNKGD